MIIKDKFVLLKDIPNVLNISSTLVKANSIENGPRKIFVILKLIEQRINHYTKDKIFKLISDVKEREKIHIVNFPSYPLHISYNRSTNGIIINLSAFGTDDISRVDPKNLYACLIYGVCFKNLVTGQAKIKESYYSIISNYYLTLFMKMFGKEYGLLGTYSTEIGKLKFLISCYILGAFFGITGEVAYKKASIVSFYNYKEILDKLKMYDFTNVDDFIKSLSGLQVMPGISKHRFTEKILKWFTINFIPAVEDLSRFMSSIATSSFSGSNVIPVFISKYNEPEYAKLIDITKYIFRR